MKLAKDRLEVLLVLRRRREQASLESFGRAFFAHQHALAQHERALRLASQTRTEQAQSLSKGISGHHLRQFHEFLDRLDGEVLQTEVALQRASQGLQAASSDLIRAQRDRDLMERYLDKRRRRVLQKLQAAEQKRLDELGNRLPSAMEASTVGSELPMSSLSFGHPLPECRLPDL